VSLNSILIDQTCWFIIQKQEYVLLTKKHTFPNQSDILSLESYFLRHFTLGQFNGIEYFCAEINENIHLNDAFHLVSLKQALSMIYPDRYAMGVKAYSVMHWDRNHQFCGRCAAPTIHRTPNFERFCPACEHSFFPRISPSIIVLIHRGDELVMARSAHFAPGIYGLIAGFVEIGESLEEAIHREVKEEVGLQVKNITYFGSQPWPFPDSLMVAFMAEYHSGELAIDNEEIEDAGWYRYDNLPGRPSTPISISSKLLDNFVHLCIERMV
jgi:NAD+ diphosphatase